MQFALIGAVAVAIVALATSTASKRVGEREAITEARTTTILRAQGLVEPLLRDEIATRDPAAVAAVRDVVDTHVLDHALVVVKLWDASGTVLYASDPRLEGGHFKLAQDDLEALENGTIQAEVSDLHAPENRYDRRFGKLLEVYLPVRTPDGTRLLFEAYFRYDAVVASGQRIWRSFAPISIGALLVLELLQIPLAWSLALRLRQRQREREALLARALEASDIERRRIATDLHDGVVQDLAGVAFSLAAASHEDAAASVRSSITSLRGVLADIYPPDVSGHGLRDAISNLAADTANADLDVRVDLQLTSALSDSVGAVLFRVVREALRNVINHAQARHVTVRAGESRGSAWVEIADDGVGFDPAVLADRAAEGHIGLRGLEGVLRDAGGTMSIDTGAGRGTTVRAEVRVQ